MTKSAQVLAIMSRPGPPLSVGAIADQLGWTDDDTKAVMLTLRRSGFIARRNQPVIALYGLTNKTPPTPTGRDRRTRPVFNGALNWKLA